MNDDDIHEDDDDSSCRYRWRYRCGYLFQRRWLMLMLMSTSVIWLMLIVTMIVVVNGGDAEGCSGDCGDHDNTIEKDVDFDDVVFLMMMGVNMFPPVNRSACRFHLPHRKWCV